MYTDASFFRPARHLVIEDEPMPLTNAPDDSDYKCDVRIVPDRKLPQDLRIVLNGECVAKIYGEDASTPRHGMANLFVQAINEDLDMRDELTSHERVNELLRPKPMDLHNRFQECPNCGGDMSWTDIADACCDGEIHRRSVITLELTQEMSLPPDFDPNDPVQLFNAHNDRDLVAEVRGLMREETHLTDEHLFDLDVAREIQNNTDAFDNVNVDTLALAVARVRLDPSDGMYNA